jgi:hypothetical protein
MATVDCVNCGRYADDMDGACPHCGKSVYGDVGMVFDNGPYPPKKDLSLAPDKPVSSSGRKPRAASRSRGGTVICGVCGSERTAGTTCPWCAQHMPQPQRRRPVRAPRPPLHPAHPQDYGWLDDLTKAVSGAQEVYDQTRADWEQADLQAKVSQEMIDSRHMGERALRPDERHDWVTHQSLIAFSAACWDAHERARERYFRLLNELGEAEQPSRALAPRRGLEDPDDPYRNTRRDDGSLAWLQRYAEATDRDRRSDRGPARGFNPG